MIGQSIGSIIVVLECIFLHGHPDYYFDTIGAPFAFPFVSMLGGSKVLTYIHYPVISSVILL
jgi:alpha-1,2-mannosyltransferase